MLQADDRLAILSNLGEAKSRHSYPVPQGKGVPVDLTPLIPWWARAHTELPGTMLLTMVFKLCRSAEKKWRRLQGYRRDP